MRHQIGLVMLALLVSGVLLMSGSSSGQAAQVTATPSVAPLTIRQPPPEVMLDYLTTVVDFSELPSPDRNISNAEWTYADVSGDGEDDLVIGGNMFVAVLLWEGDHYAVPYSIVKPRFTRNPASTTYLEDWTDDGVLEVIFDHRAVTPSGTDMWGNRWTRHVIHCGNPGGCHLAWQAPYGGIAEYHLHMRMVLLQADIQRQVTADEVRLLYLVGAFHFSMGSDDLERFDLPIPIYDLINMPSSAREPYAELAVNPRVLATYVWDGREFTPQSYDIVVEGYEVEDNSIRTATSGANEARVDGTRTGYMFEHSYQCSLWINDQLITELSCELGFVTLEWRDMTGDGVDELIMQGPVLIPNRDVSTCIYVYQLRDGAVFQIGDVCGPVMQPDLYGVRIKEAGDGQPPQIRAAHAWTNLVIVQTSDFGGGDGGWFEMDNHDDIYRWNGQEFVLVETVEREPWVRIISE